MLIDQKIIIIIVEINIPSRKILCYLKKIKHKLKLLILVFQENYDPMNQRKKHLEHQNLLVSTLMNKIVFIRIYLAPEVIAFEPVTLATDMWSIGVITYIL